MRADQSARAWRHVGPAVLALFAAMMLIAHWHEAIATLRYRPVSDPLWRGILAQFVHLSGTHTALNIAGLSCVASLAWTARQMSAAVAVLIISMVAVALGLKLETNPLLWYAGFSGALHGAFIWLALHYCTMRNTPVVRVFAWIACAFLSVKVFVGLHGASHQLTAPGSAFDIPPAPSAHWFGYLAGIFSFAAMWMCRRLRRTPVS